MWGCQSSTCHKCLVQSKGTKGSPSDTSSSCNSKEVSQEENRMSLLQWMSGCFMRHIKYAQGWISLLPKTGKRHKVYLILLHSGDLLYKFLEESRSGMSVMAVSGNSIVTSIRKWDACDVVITLSIGCICREREKNKSHYVIFTWWLLFLENEKIFIPSTYFFLSVQQQYILSVYSSQSPIPLLCHLSCVFGGFSTA